MQQSVAHRQLGEALFVASRALVGVAARSLADVHEVTLPQYRALVVVATRPVVGVSELADALDVHPTTATRMCDRLVDKRLIRRVRSAEDRRSTELHLTAAGRRIVERVAERRRRELAAIAARLPAARAAAAVDALTAFADAAGDGSDDVDLLGWAAPA